ncbi:Nn.00g007780.m01.CDS01 [Neocucurbitaria sp. VM-36]
MAKSIFQSKTQAKKAAATQKRSNINNKSDNIDMFPSGRATLRGSTDVEVAGAAPIKEQHGIGATTIIKKTSNAIGTSAIKVMPIDTTAIGFKTLRLTNDPIARPALSAQAGKKVAPSKGTISSFNVANISSVTTKKLIASPLPPHGGLIEVPASEYNPWKNTAGVKKVKSADNVMKETVASSVTPDLMPENVAPKVTVPEFPALATPLTSYFNPPSIQPTKMDSKKFNTVGRAKVAKKGSKKSPIVFTASPTARQKLEDARVTQTVHEDTPVAIAQGNTTSDEPPKSYGPTDEKEKIDAGHSESKVDTGVDLADTRATVTSPISGNITEKSSKKSGAVQKKIKAARHRRAAETNLDYIKSAAPIYIEQRPLPKTKEELEDLACDKLKLEANLQMSRSKMIEPLMWVKSKNIDVAEVAKSQWILQDKNGNFLSDDDQKKAANICTQYGAYRSACEALSMAQRAEHALVEAGVKRIFDIAPLVAVTNTAHGLAKSKSGKVPKDKQIIGLRKSHHSSSKSQLPSPPSSGGLFSSDFDFNIADDAPKFDNVSPVSAQKMNFSRTAFDTPIASVQDSGSSSTSNNTVAPLQMTKDSQDAGLAVARETTTEVPPTVELSSKISPVKDHLLSKSTTRLKENTPLQPELKEVPVEQSDHVTLAAANDSDIIAVATDDTSATQINDGDRRTEAPKSVKSVTKDAALNLPHDAILLPPANASNNTSAAHIEADVSPVQQLEPIRVITEVAALKLAHAEALPAQEPEAAIDSNKEVEQNHPDADAQSALNPPSSVRTEEEENSTTAALVLPDNSIEENISLPIDPKEESQSLHNSPLLNAKSTAYGATLPIFVDSDHVPGSGNEPHSGDTTSDMTESSLPVINTGIQLEYSDDDIQALAESTETDMHLETPSIERAASNAAAEQHRAIARHCDTTEIGIYNLRDFFTELGNSSPGKSSKAQVVIAFTKLSSREREELELGAAHGANVVAVLANKRLQHKIKLGSIKLVDFLKCIELGEDDQAEHIAIVKAFEECAKKDAEVGDVDVRLLDVGRELGWAT